MAEKHLGYPGSMNSAELALWAPNVGGAQYSVEGPNDAKVISNNVGLRGVTVKAGTVCGDGIVDIFDTDKQLNFNAVVTGNRYDMIVLRRTWNAALGASTSVYTIIEGNGNRSLPARLDNKGVVSDQPIALCKLTANQGAVQEIIDLRCWAHNGGVYAKDDLVRSYLTQPGTHVTIGSDIWMRKINHGASNDVDGWLRVQELSSFNLFGLGNALNGDPSDATQFKFQTGTAVVKSDPQGYGRITFPIPFPNGLVTVFAMNGDGQSSGATWFESAGGVFQSSGYGNKNDWVYSVIASDSNGNMVPRPNRVHRINWFAIGW